MATLGQSSATRAAASEAPFQWDVPHKPSLDAAAAEQLVDSLPEDTFQLIVREAYLFRAGEVIRKAREEAQAKREEVSSTRPPFLRLRSAETKDAFQSNLDSATQDLSLYDRAARRNAEAMKRLRKHAEVHLETCLRENDPVYYAGLVSESLVADWHRCIARLQTTLNDLISDVGSARNSLVSSQVDASGVRTVSDISRKAIMRAAQLGARLADEVKATTELAEERDRQLAGTAFAVEFPRLPSFDFGASLQQAANIAVPLLQQEFTTILEHGRELRDTGLTALLEKVKQSETQHNAIKESYLLGVWQSLRDYSLEHYVQEEDLNEVARATEEMFEDGLLA